MLLEGRAFGGAEPQVCVEGYRHMLNHDRRKQYKKNDIILLEGTIATMAQLIISGWVAYYVTTIEGATRIICIVGPKRAFAVGEAIDKLPMVASIKALTDCEVALATRDEILDIMKRDDMLRVQIVKGVSYRCRSLMESQRNYSSLIRPHDRLMNFFSSLLLSSSWEERDGWVIVPVGLTHEIIADVIDASRVTVSRLLAQFAKDGIVKKGEKGHYYLKAELFDRASWG